MSEQEQEPQRQYKRPLPQSELDLNLMLTNTMWGNPELSETIKQKLNKGRIIKDEQGNAYVDKQDLWGLLGFYSRDLRLANLSSFNGELEYCKYHLNLANDFLHCDFVEPFLICLSRVATVLELSQSKGGFLRRRQNTFTTEQMQQNLEPPKKNIWGIQKQEQ